VTPSLRVKKMKFSQLRCSSGVGATAAEEGDDRVSGTDADGHDHISRNGSSEFGGNADSAVSLTRPTNLLAVEVEAPRQ
jgi:hypothetical protein